MQALHPSLSSGPAARVVARNGATSISGKQASGGPVRTREIVDGEVRYRAAGAAGRGPPSGHRPGRYTDDIDLAGQAHGYVLRSPLAMAVSASIDLERREGRPGRARGLHRGRPGRPGIPCLIPMQNRDGSDRADPKHPVLCKDEVNYVGDHVAFVVAETRLRRRTRPS